MKGKLGIEMKQEDQAQRAENAAPRIGGWTGWLLERLRGARTGGGRPRLALVERITLAPRQSLALIEAEGRHLLVATSPEGAPAFYSLDGTRLSALASPRTRSRRTAPQPGRVSW